MDPLVLENKPVYPLGKCGHVLHKDCYSNYLSSEIKKHVFPIVCPFFKCNTTVSNESMTECIGDKNLLQIYSKYSFERFIEKNDDAYSWCPKVGCDYVFAFSGEQHFVCPLCKSDFCLQCKQDWHRNISCKENEKNKDVNYLD
jgi:hypothetical protein